MRERRVRAGRFEWFCDRAGVWYRNLASHVHRYHRKDCTCTAVCLPAIKHGTIQPRGWMAK